MAGIAGKTWGMVPSTRSMKENIWRLRLSLMAIAYLATQPRSKDGSVSSAFQTLTECLPLMRFNPESGRGSGKYSKENVGGCA